MPRGADAAAWRDVQEATERIVPWYDRVNFVNTFGRVWFWRQRLAGLVRPDDVVLEIGSGPGSFARLVRARRVHCVDPSPSMARVARERLGDGPHRFVNGVAEDLPFRAGSVDKVFCSWSFRQFFDKRAAIREIVRVLRPGGELHILEAARPPPGLRRAFMDSWLAIGVPAIVTVLVPRRVRRRWEEQPFAAFVRSYAAMEPPEAYADAMRASGFSDVALDYLSMRSVFHLQGVRARTT